MWRLVWVKPCGQGHIAASAKNTTWIHISWFLERSSLLPHAHLKSDLRQGLFSVKLEQVISTRISFNQARSNNATIFLKHAVWDLIIFLNIYLVHCCNYWLVVHRMYLTYLVIYSSCDFFKLPPKTQFHHNAWPNSTIMLQICLNVCVCIYTYTHTHNLILNFL